MVGWEVTGEAGDKIREQEKEKMAIRAVQQKAQVARVTIKPPNMQVARLPIFGTETMKEHRFAAKAKLKMQETQEAGSTAQSKKTRTKRDFNADYQESVYRFKGGGYGIPACAFRNAMIAVAAIGGYVKTRAKMSVFIVNDGVSEDEGIGLVRITKGEPHMTIDTARNDDGSCDLRARGTWDPGWEAQVTVRFDADQLTADDIANLLWRAGIQCGIMEGRPNSKNSNGMGWGTFEVMTREGMLQEAKEREAAVE